MIDALLHAVKDGIINVGYDYDTRTCAVMADGMPPARCGDVFVAVHETSAESTFDNCKNDLLGFFLTVTMRVSDVPFDRIGDRRLARKLARERGFNFRCDQLADFLHMDWGVLQDANQNLIDFNPDADLIYGFCEPCRYRGRDKPVLVGGEWFQATTESEVQAQLGLRSELRFEEARRIQAIAHYV